MYYNFFHTTPYKLNQKQNPVLKKFNTDKPFHPGRCRAIISDSATTTLHLGPLTPQ